MPRESPIPIVHMVDAMWCDAHGVFAKGWVHAFEHGIRSVSLSSGTARATDRVLHERADLAAFFPALPSRHCGFSIYLACPPFRPVFLEFETAAGIVRRELEPLSDDHPLNALPPSLPDPMPAFIAEMKAKQGLVVEIGAPAVSLGQVLQADRFRPECTFIGVDIHAAPGVDVVADAHFLSDHLPRGSVDGLFSQAVMEHLAFPWLFAGEINKVLKLGGLTLHVVPQTYPLHELPNDFWRMSDEALRVLFSKETGFEVLASGMSSPVRMFAHPAMREQGLLENALFDGMLSSVVLARKVAEIDDDAIKWPVAKASSLERGRKYPGHQPPAAPLSDATEPLVFDKTGSAIVAPCPACGAEGEKRRLLTALRVHSLYRCDACGSSFYAPFPHLDYERHTPDLVLRDYVEMGASVDFPARNILRLIPEGRKGRLLDVGCGFGFALDVARALAGWDVKGFEPSQYGAIGATELGLDISPTYAAMNDGETRYDIVYCSEVIEHVHDPAAFLAILCSYLDARGVLVLTSPNPDAVVEGKAASRLLPLLSPGAHTILFSDRAMTTLLGNAGLAFTHVDKSDETTLYYASRRPIEFARTDIGPNEIIRYYDTALRRAAPGTPLETGLRYRLFRAAMDHARYDIAKRAYRPTLAALDPRPEDIASIADFAERWPLCIAASTYYCGMFQLLVARDNRLAARHFRAAFALCRKKLALSPANAGVEADLVWRAVYHEALACSWDGDADAAARALEPLLEPALTPPMPADLDQSVDSLVKTLNILPDPILHL